jgi:hypothetical protein
MAESGAAGDMNSAISMRVLKQKWLEKRMDIALSTFNFIHEAVIPAQTRIQFLT